jgi:branched-chain amino acid aminotransferase
MAGVAWVNGRIVAADEPAVAVTDPGFLYGEGLFETMRVYQGRVFRLGAHLARMAEGARALGLAAPPRETLTGAVSAALEASGLAEASVRLTLTPGPAGTAAPTVVVLVRPLVLPPEEHYRAGVRAVTVPIAMAGSTPLRTAKSLCYLDKLLAQRAAVQAGAHEALLVEADGSVIEAAMRNVFMVTSGGLVTPPLTRGLLAGVTRAAVLSLTGQVGVPASERDFTQAELTGAEECFLTSSLAEILPVASVNGSIPHRGAPGPVTRALTDAYRALVRSELGLETNCSG